MGIFEDYTLYSTKNGLKFTPKMGKFFMQDCFNFTDVFNFKNKRELFNFLYKKIIKINQKKEIIKCKDLTCPRWGGLQVTIVLPKEDIFKGSANEKFYDKEYLNVLGEIFLKCIIKIILKKSVYKLNDLQWIIFMRVKPGHANWAFSNKIFSKDVKINQAVLTYHNATRSIFGARPGEIPENGVVFDGVFLKKYQT